MDHYRAVILPPLAQSWPTYSTVSFSSSIWAVGYITSLLVLVNFVDVEHMHTTRCETSLKPSEVWGGVQGSEGLGKTEQGPRCDSCRAAEKCRISLQLCNKGSISADQPTAWERDFSYDGFELWSVTEEKAGFSRTVTDRPAKKKKIRGLELLESTTRVHNEDHGDAVVLKGVTASALQDLIG